MYEHVVSHGRTYHRYKDGSKLWILDDGMSLMLLENIYFLTTRSVGGRKSLFDSD
jgi:hypothetical protein